MGLHVAALPLSLKADVFIDVGDQLLLMLNASKLRESLYRSLNGRILLRRISSRYDAGCKTLFTGKNGTRLPNPEPLIEKVLNCPGTTTVELSKIVGLP